MKIAIFKFDFILFGASELCSEAFALKTLLWQGPFGVLKIKSRLGFNKQDKHPTYCTVPAPKYNALFGIDWPYMCMSQHRTTSSLYALA